MAWHAATTKTALVMTPLRMAIWQSSSEHWAIEHV
jgi:hypothetical protein